MNRLLATAGLFQRTVVPRVPPLLISQLSRSLVTDTSQPPKAPVADAENVFHKIIKREIPADIIYEDDKCLAFNDIAPQGPVHFLIIPKRCIEKLEDGTPEDGELFGHLMVIAGWLGKERAPQGFRVVVNNGHHACQTVPHLHMHVIGGRQLKWPPG